MQLGARFRDLRPLAGAVEDRDGDPDHARDHVLAVLPVGAVVTLTVAEAHLEVREGVALGGLDPLAPCLDHLAHAHEAGVGLDRRLLQTTGVQRDAVEAHRGGSSDRAGHFAVEQRFQTGLGGQPALVKHEQLVQHAGYLELGRDQLLLHPRSQRVARLGDAHQALDGLLVAPGHLHGPVDVGELVVRGLHLANDAGAGLRDFDLGRLGLLLRHGLRQPALARERQLLGDRDLLLGHVVVFEAEVRGQVRDPDAQHGVLEGARLRYFFAHRLGLPAGSENLGVVAQGLVHQLLDVEFRRRRFVSGRGQGACWEEQTNGRGKREVSSVSHTTTSRWTGVRRRPPVEPQARLWAGDCQFAGITANRARRAVSLRPAGWRGRPGASSRGGRGSRCRARSRS